MTKHPDCEDGCQLKEHKGYRDCSETGVCHFMTDSKKEELLKLCETVAHADNNSGPRLLRRLAKEMKSLLTERDAERAGFLRQHPIGSINEAGYHFVNAQTEKDRVEWWNILKERIVAAVTNRPSREGQPFGNLAAAPKQEKPE